MSRARTSCSRRRCFDPRLCPPCTRPSTAATSRPTSLAGGSPASGKPGSVLILGSGPVVIRQAAAFDYALDTPAALGTLHVLAEDGAIAPGAKFETFAYLDQLLGLDLAREVGQ